MDPLAANTLVSPPFAAVYHEPKDAAFSTTFHRLGERAGAEDVRTGVLALRGQRDALEPVRVEPWK